ncbi:hypothetical protein BH20ACI4_BH20ACI4_07770 [soil metagenome]
MRKILVASIFVPAFCAFAFGQNSDCPEITLTGPPGVVRANETATFTVNVYEKPEGLKLEYVWSIDGGKIVEGQGTQVLTIDIGNNEFSYATVEIKGLPRGCENIFTESLGCGIAPPEPIIIDELVTSDSAIDSAKFDKIITALKDDPSSTVYIVIYTDEKTPPEKLEQKQIQIRNVLREKNIPPDRIVLIIGGEGEDLIRLWLAPVGAEPPTP